MTGLSKRRSISYRLTKGRETVRKAAKGLSATLDVLRKAEEELGGKQAQLMAVQQALDEQRERYRALFEFSPDARLVTDLQGSILEANRTASVMLHVSPDMLSHKLFLLFLAEGDRRRVRLLLFGLKERSAAQVQCEVRVRPRGRPGFPAAVVGMLAGGPKVATPSVQWLVRDISEQKRTEETLRDREAALCRSQTELRALTGRLLTAQDQERQRMARDLHDDIIQRLALLAIDIEALDMQVPFPPEALHERLGILHRRVMDLSNEIRGLAHHLHPGILQDLGLPIALQRYAGDFSERTGIKCTVRATSFPPSVPLETATSLYKIGQECLGNALKHAEASEIEVELAGSHGFLHLTVTDNGKGFHSEAASGAVQGLGFVSMRERARILGGECIIESQPGRGTTIMVRVPL